MTKEQKYPLAEPASYTPPQMEVIPLRGNEMLCLSAGMPYEQDDKMILDFFKEGDEVNPGNLNSQFETWADESGSSFF